MKSQETEKQHRKKLTIQDLEKRIGDLFDALDSEDNRLKMRDTITQIYENLKSSKNVPDSNKTRSMLYTSIGMLKQKYRDSISFPYASTPRS